MRLFVVVVVVVIVAGGCVDACLPAYTGGRVSCVKEAANGAAANDDDVDACPEGFQCLDPRNEGLPTCVRTGCGDGEIARGDREACDDANDNDGDLCHGRRPDDDRPDGDRSSDDPAACVEASFCPTVAIGFETANGDPVGSDIGHPFVVAADLLGNLYISSIGTNFVTRVDGTSGQLSRFAGNGTSVGVVDVAGGLAANEVSTALIGSMAADGVGNVYLGDLRSNTIVRINADFGDAVAVAGDGREQPSSNHALAATSSIRHPVGLTVAGDGTLYFIESVTDDEFALRRVRLDDGTIEHLPFSAPGAPPGLVDHVHDLDFDDEGNLWLVAPEARALVKLGRVGLDDAPARPLEASLVPLDRCDPSLCVRNSTSTGDALVAKDQARIAVSPDGTAVYFPCGDSLLRLDTGDSGACAAVPFAPLSAACAGPGTTIPLGDTGGSGLFATGISDVALVNTSDGYDVVAADPARGLVHRFHEVTRPSSSGASSSTGARPDFGLCYEGGDALLADALSGFCAETDCRIGLSATDACCGFDGCAAERPLDPSAYEFYLPSPANHIVARVGCNAAVAVEAGGATAGFDGDEPRPARGALLDEPVAASATRDGAIYIADVGNRRVRRVFVSPTAVGACAAGESCIETVVGPCADDAVDDSHCVHRPGGLAVDAGGGVVVTDAGRAPGQGRLVRLVPPPAPLASSTEVTLETIDDGLFDPAAVIVIGYAIFPPGLAPDCAPVDGVAPPCGLAIYAETGAHRVRARALAPAPFLLDGPLLFAGTPLDTTALPGDDDGDIQHGRLRFPRGLMLDAPTTAPGTDVQTFNFLVVDAIDRIRRVALPFDPAGWIGTLPALPTTLSTVSPRSSSTAGRSLSHDDATAGSGVLKGATDITLLDDGRLLLVDGSGRLRVATLDDDGAVTSLQTLSGVDGGADFPACEPGTTTSTLPASEVVPLVGAAGLVRDGDVVYVAETAADGAARVRRFHVPPADRADDVTAWTTDALCLPASGLVAPSDLAIDPDGADGDGVLYVADRAVHVVVAVDLGDLATPPVVVAGRFGKRGFFGDDGRTTRPTTAPLAVTGETFEAHRAAIDALCRPRDDEAVAGRDALLNEPQGLLFSRRGGHRYLFIADTGNQRVRRVDLDVDLDGDEEVDGVIGTVVGDGSLASGGEGAPAARFPVAAPRGLDVDAWGNLFVTSSNAVRLVAADTTADACGTATTSAGVADGGDAVATIYGRERDGVPEAVTRCLRDVVVDPRSPPGATVAWAVDSCIGMLVRLERGYGACDAR
jgi:hypothetical protein